MNGYYGHIEQLTLENDAFRQVLYTGRYTQLVLMSLKPGEDIGLETHHDTDQFFRFEAGHGEVIIGQETYQITDGDSVIIPAGSPHNVTNTSNSKDLKLYTLYSPPHHQEGTVHMTREKALAAEDHES